MTIAESYFYFSNLTAPDEQLHVSRMAFAEPMPPGVINRSGTHDLFLLLLPAGCVVKDRIGIHHLEKPAFIYWHDQQAHFYGNGEARWSHTWMHVSGAWLKRLRYLCPSDSCVLLDDVQTFERLYSMIYEELQRFRPDKKIVSHLIEHMLLRAQRHVDESDTDVEDIPAVFTQIKYYMDNQYALPLSLKDLADRCALSTSHFSNRFRYYYACSPIDYLIRVRMEQAKHMLSNRNLRISEVSQLVGYDDIGYFSRLLKRSFGLNPRELRKQLLVE